MIVRVGFDMDGVLADFSGAFREHARSLRRLGAEVVETIPFRDHQWLEESDARRLQPEWQVAEACAPGQIRLSHCKCDLPSVPNNRPPRRRRGRAPSGRQDQGSG